MNTLRTSLGMFIRHCCWVSSQVFAAEFTLRIQHFLGDGSLPHKRADRAPGPAGSRLNPADA